MISVKLSGHTLLELLVAIVITALIAAGGYAGLNAISRASAAHRQEVQSLAAVQWFVSRLDRDLFHAINRPVRSDSGKQPALSGDTATLSLTHGGLSNPLHQARSDLQRVSWTYSDEGLYRAASALLDGPPANASTERLLNDISAMAFEYLGTGSQWHSRWPSNSEEGLPRAVRYRLEINGFGVLERIVELPGQRS
jgi:general secretion pathway protein J